MIATTNSQVVASHPNHLEIVNSLKKRSNFPNFPKGLSVNQIIKGKFVKI